jgi:hypothetical protein
MLFLKAWGRKFSFSMERESFLEDLRIISDYRLSFLKSAGNLNPDEIIESGVNIYFMYIRPYLAKKAEVEITGLLKLI